MFIKTLCIEEMKTVGRGCRVKTKGLKIEAEGRERGGVLGRGQQAPPARGRAVM